MWEFSFAVGEEHVVEGMNAGFELCSIDWGGDELDCTVAIDKMGLMTKVFDGRS